MHSRKITANYKCCITKIQLYRNMYYGSEHVRLAKLLRTKKKYVPRSSYGRDLSCRSRALSKISISNYCIDPTYTPKKVEILLSRTFIWELTFMAGKTSCSEEDSFFQKLPQSHLFSLGLPFLS